MAALVSRTLAQLRERAESLGLTLLSSSDDLEQRHRQDEATLETLRGFAAQSVDGQPAESPSADLAEGPGGLPELSWTGRRGLPTPPELPVVTCEAPTWITVLDSPRVQPGGPLTGFEVGVKDLLDVEGCTATAGTRAHRAAPARRDAPAVHALRATGATIRGTTNLHALAYGATGTSSDWGVPHNPASPGAIPGGSSSGSAAAVAEGSAALTLGTDTSGSIRIPAALCGVVGLKPTRGLINLEGCHPLAPTQDLLRPLAGSVAVVAAAMSAMAGWDSSGASTPGGSGAGGSTPGGSGAGEDAWQLPEEPRGRIRIGVLGGYFDEGLSAPIRVALDAALTLLDAAGVELTPVELCLARHIPGAQIVVLGAEALATNLPTLRAHGRELPADVRLRLEAGLARTDEQQAVARELTVRWRRQVDAALAHCHVLLCPTTAITATAPEVSHVEVDGDLVTVQFSLTRLTMPFNFSGHPAISLPWRDSAGTLLGVQLIGRTGGDQDLLAVASHVEQLLA